MPPVSELCAAFGLALVAVICGCARAQTPVLSNPGLAPQCTMEIRDRLDATRGYVACQVTMALDSTGKYYTVRCVEGDRYVNEIRLRGDDLTSASEKRIDLRTGGLIEQYDRVDDTHVHLYNRDKKIDRQYRTSDRNIYSRYAYFVSFMGFPFETTSAVSFKTYMFEYGDALTMRLHNLGPCRVTVPAGSFDCYKLELSVGGWQSVFSHDKFYLYFDTKRPHYFVRYDEKDRDGTWYSNELVALAPQGPGAGGHP